MVHCKNTRPAQCRIGTLRRPAAAGSALKIMALHQFRCHRSSCRPKLIPCRTAFRHAEINRAAGQKTGERMSARLWIATLLAITASAAAAEEIRVKNDGDAPIYKLYAWASDLTPSTDSVIVFPIFANEVDTVTIDNPWSDCMFTFMIDHNSPDDLRKLNYRRHDNGFVEVNICRRGSKPISLK
jgi:hypothetical protein